MTGRPANSASVILWQMLATARAFSATDEFPMPMRRSVRIAIPLSDAAAVATLSDAECSSLHAAPQNETWPRRPNPRARSPISHVTSRFHGTSHACR